MRRPESRARGLVPVPSDALRAFLADPRNQETLLGLTAPSVPRALREWLRRSARIATVERGRRVEVSVGVGRLAALRVRWELEPLRAATGVEVVTRVPLPALLGGLAARHSRASVEALEELGRLAGSEAARAANCAV